MSVPDYLVPDARSECSTYQMEELLAWFRQGKADPPR